MADQYTLSRWTHPRTDQKRVYINGDDLNGVKIFVRSCGRITQVMYSGDPEELPRWMHDDAAKLGIQPHALVVRMALEDADLPISSPFGAIWDAAD